MIPLHPMAIVTAYNFAIPHGDTRLSVKVEIGDIVPDYRDNPITHWRPTYRVTIDGTVIGEGSDWGVPIGKSTDDIDAALDLLMWFTESGQSSDTESVEGFWTSAFPSEAFDMWVQDRQMMRAALRDYRECWGAAAEFDSALDVARAVRAGELEVNV